MPRAGALYLIFSQLTGLMRSYGVTCRLSFSLPYGFLLQVLCLSLLLGHFGCIGSLTPAVNKSPSSASTSTLPDFELETLEGDAVRLSDYLGKEVILIDFWATFCDPCLAAFPHLNQLYKKYQKEGFVILAVSVDGPESVSNVRAVTRRHHLEFPVLLDQESSVVALYPKSSAPFSILIDRNGKIVKQKEGFTPTDIPLLEAAIELALASETTSVR